MDNLKMCDDELQSPKRFKAIENFLRRVAFNLGNSPSQTEVKIISCIPIDVTDLQQKILSLEKELQEAKFYNVKRQKSKSDGPATTECAALYGSAITANVTNTLSHFNVKTNENHQQRSLPRCCECFDRKSNISLIFPTPGNEQTCNFASAETSVKESKGANMQYKNTFKKRIRKKLLKRDTRNKTHLIYYAQTRTRSPKLAKQNELVFSNNQTFTSNNNVHKNIPEKYDELSCEYLVNIFRKHHDPQLVLNKFSDTSNFSKPVCRDTELEKSLANSSDICSCFQGTFQDIDKHTKKAHYQTDITNLNYYDMNVYDVTPVREKPFKHKKENYPKSENISNMMGWPAESHSKYRYHPFTVDNETDNLIKKAVPKNLKNKLKKRKIAHGINVNLDVVRNSKSCSVDLGHVYQRPIPILRQSNKYVSVTTETDVTEINKLINKERENIKQANTIVDNKTEDTLNQIKDILQSVLKEVKTNPNVNSTLEDKTEKDAVVQNRSSHNIQGASTLLHSFTYNSSYSANPYVPSHSRQISHGPYCFRGVSPDQYKYWQNFPIFIHPSHGRHICYCHYKNSDHKTNKNKRATTIATNTENDVKKTESKETEKLIKEIYKSITLNMDFTNKDLSVSEYDDLKSLQDSVIMRTKDKLYSNSESGDIQEEKTEKILKPFTSNATESKLVYSVVSSQWPIQKKTMVDKSQLTHTECETPDTVEENIQTMGQYEETTVSSDDEESDTTELSSASHKDKKDRSGFFKKMIKTVKLFNKKKEVKHLEEGEKDDEGLAASESDDYETIYSEKINKKPVYVKPRRKNVIEFYRPPKNANYIKAKRTPYMEQEYRRRWNEILMFRDNQNLGSPVYEKEENRHPAFWQEYETRNIFIKPNKGALEREGKQTSTNKTTNEKILKNKLAWLNKHKMGIKCGNQWKKLLLEG